MANTYEITAYFEHAGVSSPLSDKADTVPGYDFLVNSVWPEMIKGIEERLAYLFSPGNPDIFYEVQPQWIHFFVKDLLIVCSHIAQCLTE